MRKLFAIAAFLLASTAAQAQYTFEYGGRTIRIDPDRGTVSIPGVYDNTGRKSKRSRSDRTATVRANRRPIRRRSIRRRPPRPRADRTGSCAREHPARAFDHHGDRCAHGYHYLDAPAQRASAAASAGCRPRRQAGCRPRRSRPLLRRRRPRSPATASANSPLGLWLTEEKEGKVRIEQCGANLCGYSVDGSRTRTANRF